MRLTLVILAVLCGAALVAGSFGSVHPAGDSFAVFRLWLVFPAILLALVLRAMQARVTAGIMALLAAVYGAGPMLRLSLEQGRQPTIQGGYTLYQHNLLFVNRTPERILQEIQTRRPDFLTLQEVSRSNDAAIMQNLPEGYHAITCHFAGPMSVSVVSRHPMLPEERRCVAGSGLVAQRVATPDGPLWVAGLHLHWPWPFGQALQAERVVRTLETLEGPVILAGDFNMVSWSHRLRSIASALEGERLAQGAPTFHFAFGGITGPGIEIDHVVFANGSADPGASATVERLDFFGADHRALFVRFAL